MCSLNNLLDTILYITLCSGQCKYDSAPHYTPGCSAQEKNRFASNDYCGLLQDKKGVLSTCISKVDSTGFYQNCLYDTCANAANQTHAKDAACGSLEVMAAECAQIGLPVQWRTAANCRE